MAAAVVLVGFVVEFSRLGMSDAVAAASLERDVRDQFAATNRELVAVANHIATNPAVAAAMGSDAAADADARARTLFTAAAREHEAVADESRAVAVTIYDTAGAPRGWAGRASDLPKERTKATTASLFVAPSPLGLRLVYLEPIAGDPAHVRLGSVAAEGVLTAPPPASILLTTSSYEMVTPRGTVSLRVHQPGAPSPPERPDERHFAIVGTDGTALVDASVSYAAVGRDRDAHRRAVAGLALGVFAITILLLT